MKSTVLTPEAANRTIQRMAYEIVEQHYGEVQICLAGIAGNGAELSYILGREIIEISDLSVSFIKITLDKKNPFSHPIEVSKSLEFHNQMPIVLIDDVANSGSTLFYALRLWMNSELTSLKTAVLVDRSHKRFPISPDFIGVSLATTLQEHVEVIIENHQVEAFLI